MIANMKLVHKQANMFSRKYSNGQEYEDIVQDGFAGLMTAALKYDPARKNKFSTMAYPWIMQSIIRESNKKSRLVRLPENRINDFIHINRILEQIDTERDDLTQKEREQIVMERLDLKQSDLVNILDAARQHVSLNKPMSDEEGSRELVEFVADVRASKSSEETFFENDMENLLMQQLSNLSEIEQDVIKSFCKFDPKLTVEKVREKYGITKSGFKKIQLNALKKLRKNIVAPGYSFADFVA